MLSKTLASIAGALVMSGSVMAQTAADIDQPKLNDEQALQQAVKLIYDTSVFVAGYCRSNLPKAELEYEAMIKHLEGLAGLDTLKVEIPKYAEVRDVSAREMKRGLLDTMRQRGQLTKFCTSYVDGYKGMDKKTYWDAAKKAAKTYKENHGK